MTLGNGLVLLVAVLHLGFLVLEMHFWTKPLGRKIFRQSLADAKTSRVLAANQGLYNGFLSAGLIWSLVKTDPIAAGQIQFFFLSCVIVAGIFGALTVNRRIFLIQALPALVALLLIWS